MEFLVTSRTALPEAMPTAELERLRQAERARAIELFEAGLLRRIWRLPGTRAAVHLYDVGDASELHSVLASLPQFRWMDIQVQALARHPVELDIEQRHTDSDGTPVRR
jgi:muconolactone delta-isomerase